MNRLMLKFAAVLVAFGLWSAMGSSQAQAGNDPPLPRMYYYPYSYFPHNYWPQQSPQWPEPKGHPYVRPPAYMAYPPFLEPGWRHELFEPMRFYRGNHFWLDQF